MIATTAATAGSPVVPDVPPSTNPANARPRICRRMRALDARVTPRNRLRWPMRDAPIMGEATVPMPWRDRASPTTKSEPESRNR